jgi:hypothetical protein
MICFYKGKTDLLNSPYPWYFCDICPCFHPVVAVTLNPNDLAIDLLNFLEAQEDMCSRVTRC